MLGWRNCWRISASRSNRSLDLALLGKLAADDLHRGGVARSFRSVPR